MANIIRTRKRLTVYIGRFQPFHNGHIYILEQALKSSDKVLVLIGSSYIARNIKNPFTFDERRDMISNWSAEGYADGKFDSIPIVRPLRDQPYNNAKWFQAVQEAVDETIATAGWRASDVDVAITGADRDSSTWYLKAFPQYDNDLKNIDPSVNMSGTALRERLFNHDNGNQGAFEIGMHDMPVSTWHLVKKFMVSKEYETLKAEYDFNLKYKEQFSSLKYEPTFVTADSVIIQSGHVLVVVRGALPGKGLWALPGGFVKGHQTLLQAAVCEVIEETGLKLAEGKKSKEITESILTGSLRAKENFDDPNRSLRGRTFTTAFLFRLDDSKPLPFVKGQFAPLEDTNGVEGIVETADAFWLPISVARANSDKWFDDHHALLDWGVSMCN